MIIQSSKASKPAKQRNVQQLIIWIWLLLAWYLWIGPLSQLLRHRESDSTARTTPISPWTTTTTLTITIPGLPYPASRGDHKTAGPRGEGRSRLGTLYLRMKKESPPAGTNKLGFSFSSHPSQLNPRTPRDVCSFAVSLSCVALSPVLALPCFATILSCFASQPYVSSFSNGSQHHHDECVLGHWPTSLCPT